MMNTLQTSTINAILSKSKSFQEALSLFSLPLESNAFPCEIEGLQGSLPSFFVSAYAKKNLENLLQSIKYSQLGRYTKADEMLSSGIRDIALIVATENEAQDIYYDIKTIFNDSKKESSPAVYIMPWWGTVPYRPVAPGSIVFGQRIGVLAKIADPSQKNLADISKIQTRIFIIPQRSLLIPVPPKDSILSLCLDLQLEQKIDPLNIAEHFIRSGYTRVPRVSVKGEIAIRGEVLDIFMPQEDYAHRIVFDFDTITKIKSFDVESQATIADLDALLLYPMKEVLWDEEKIAKLSDYFEKNKSAFVLDVYKEEGEKKLLQKNIAEKLDAFIQALSERGEVEGEEFFYPLVFDTKTSVLDYFSPDATVFYLDYDRMLNALEGIENEFLGLYKRALQYFNAEGKLPPLPPSVLKLPFEDIFHSFHKKILFRSLQGPSLFEKEKIQIISEPSKSFFGNINYLKESLESLLADDWQVFIFAESENQALRINELLKDFSDELYIIPEPISSGFSMPDIKVLVLKESEIFGRRKQRARSIKHVKSQVIESFVELNPGDYVVHVNYGIGLFEGIERIKSLGNERDYIRLLYAGEEVLFIPIEQVNLVQRYIGNEGNKPNLDTLGSKSWENRKNRVKKSVEDIAEHLIGLYSKRQASRGFPFPKDGEWQLAFEAAFPYVETDDQIKVAKEIKEDMEKATPMDRLVCGDVGYGKTEMAMRASFKAVMGGKQVAFLAPTTILAEQHYETLLERFEKFPVKIAHMSRFVTKAEQKKIIERLALGEIDILIGTHRIIQKDIVFKNLGLMIIDEEQRFGVKDKERLKEMKANIDSLAMTATPIPRTLHMSLLKIRDMSLLETAPQNRQAIETIIDPYNDERVAQAIRQEVERGGQVFYLHNRVESLEEVQYKLEKILPEMMIDYAHGQMSPKELEDIFRRFKMGGFHVLLATTIIENGIDIPNVNTIIIDRADMYGVSQLYQLRGRVGRSDRKAYAYLLYPEGKSLSEIAMKRLQVISDFTELGSGFKIAMKDMEIRGAGNLLGKDQSGDVYSVGFDLYVRLLEEAVNKLMDENYEESGDVLLELDYSGFIPETYIENPVTKMELYKKIASIGSQEEIEGFYMELEDRFGPIPDEVFSLLAIAEIRIICKKLSIASLKERMGVLYIEFAKIAKIDVQKVLYLIQTSSGRIKLDPNKANILQLATGKIGLKEKSAFIREKLETLL